MNSSDKKPKFFRLAPGIILCLAIAVPAWFLGKCFPIVGGPVFSILIGIIVATVVFPRVNHGAVDEGRQYTGKKILQYAIILLGFGMNFVTVLQVGARSFYVMLFTFAAAFLTAWVAYKALKLQGRTATLIGVGTAICGGSAIAAAAPVIGAEDDEIARSVSTIFLFNVIAVFIFPAIGRLFGMSDTGFGLWAGTAINDTSSVVAAGIAWSSYAGSTAALDFATVVKLSRALMIVPVTLALAIITARRRRKSTSEEDGKAVASFGFAKVFPWFVAGFLAAALISTLTGLPEGVTSTLYEIGKFMIVAAMAAIGLGTNLKKLFTGGVGFIVLGLCCWFAVAAVSIAVQVAMGTL